jgi:hypothetical protein
MPFKILKRIICYFTGHEMALMLYFGKEHPMWPYVQGDVLKCKKCDKRSFNLIITDRKWHNEDHSSDAV